MRMMSISDNSSRERKPDIAWFAREILAKHLYSYQETIGNAILDSVLNNKGHTITCMLARQMGKNETSAIVEAYLLLCMESGTVVKAAPTYKPQLINSMLRLSTMLEAPLIRERIWKAHGYIIGLAPSQDMVESKSGPCVMFFSAAPDASIVGATASLLLEIDEAQDVTHEKFNVELRPMASTTNATTVMYGTAWSDDTLLAQQIAHNQELEQQDGIRRHFAYDWSHLARTNNNYKHFVEAEIARLGDDHISIRTQFRLLPISGAGLLLNDLQRQLLHGVHSWMDETDEEQDEGYFVAGLDVGGEERAKPGDSTTISTKRDSTILSIARVQYNELDLPALEVVHQQHWHGMSYLDQYAAISSLMESWNIRRLVIDKTGLGEGLASLLIEKFGDERIQAFHFSRPSKSKLVFQFLGMVNSGRIKIYSQEDAPQEVYDECWKQLKFARYAIPGEGLINAFVPPEEGHDDFLMSLLLCAEAIQEFEAPIQKAAIVKPRRSFYDGRF